MWSNNRLIIALWLQTGAYLNFVSTLLSLTNFTSHYVVSQNNHSLITLVFYGILSLKSFVDLFCNLLSRTDLTPVVLHYLCLCPLSNLRFTFFIYSPVLSLDVHSYTLSVLCYSYEYFSCTLPSLLYTFARFHWAFNARGQFTVRSWMSIWRNHH